jgi:hypothetical protein
MYYGGLNDGRDGYNCNGEHEQFECSSCGRTYDDSDTYTARGTGVCRDDSYLSECISGESGEICTACYEIGEW